MRSKKCTLMKEDLDHPSEVEIVFASACLPLTSSCKPIVSPSLSELMKLMLTGSLSLNPQSLSIFCLFPLTSSLRVFTVFSTSKDHGQGRKAMAGCILVDVDKIQVINRSPAYKNKYIHHRTSVGCDLSDEQVLLPIESLFLSPHLFRS